MPLEESLAKIRPHTGSQLPHQKAPAQLLVAMEDSFEERTPTAYFAATLSCLQAQLSSEEEQSFGEGDRLPAILYLLALILPFVPPAIIRSHLSTILNILTSIFSSLHQHAPALRSGLSISGAFLRSLDRGALVDTHDVRKLFSSLLDNVSDDRPKVRKKAAEEVREILDAPPSPMQVHPYAVHVMKWATSKLGSGNENEIHIVVFLRNVLPSLHLDTQPTGEVEELPTRILSLTKMHNPHLEAAAYSLLSDLLSLSMSSNQATIATLLNNVPSPLDAQLSSAWASVFTSLALTPTISSSNTPSSTADFLKIFQTLFNFLTAQNPALQRAASGALSGFVGLNFGTHIDPGTKEGRSCIDSILDMLSQSLVALPFAHAIPYSLNVLAATLANFPYSSSTKKGKALSNEDSFKLVTSLITSVSKLRISQKFHHKEVADRVFVSVYTRWGARRLLELVPLNIEPSDRYVDCLDYDGN